MTITLTLETETRLREQARREGQDINSLANTLLIGSLSQAASLSDPDELTDAEIAEIRVGIGRGLEAVLLGHVKPLSQDVTEARQRHGFPASWANNAFSPQSRSDFHTE